MTQGRVLVADDQSDAQRPQAVAGGEGYDVTTASSPKDLVATLEGADFDVALIDLNYTRDTTSGHEGFALLERMKAIDPTLPVLVMTGWSSVTGVVEAMRRGARDYIEKPWDDENRWWRCRPSSNCGAHCGAAACRKKTNGSIVATCRPSSRMRLRCAPCATRSSAWHRRCRRADHRRTRNRQGGRGQPAAPALAPFDETA